MVEVGPHAAGVKVHDGGSVGFQRVSVVVDEHDDNDVIANVTLALQLGENQIIIISRKWKRWGVSKAMEVLVC